MGIVRTERPDGDWFMAHKGWAQDERLTWDTRGLLAYLFTKPDDWEVRVHDLVASGPCGKYKIRRMLKELEEYGYADREKTRDPEDGTFGWVTTIHERPSPTQSRMDSVQTGDSRGYTKDTSSTKEGEEGSRGSAREARMPDELLPLYDTYQPEIERLLAEYEPGEADQVLIRQWGWSSVGSTVLHLAREYSFPYFVTGVVVTANEADNPNPRYLDSFLHAVTKLDGHTPEDPTESEQQSTFKQLWNAARSA